MNAIKVQWRRFQRFLGTFTILLDDRSSETRIFRHLSDYVFGVRNFKNTKCMRVTFLEIKIDLKNEAKNSEKKCCFWDNCIGIGIVKLLLLRTGYFSSTAKALTSSPKIYNVNKRKFLEQNFRGIDQWIQ